MSFTDEELEVLKAMCRESWPIDGKRLSALLARLEAAELTITHAKDFAELQERLKVWRKAAGRVQE